jgi:hypothetical protein
MSLSVHGSKCCADLLSDLSSLIRLDCTAAAAAPCETQGEQRRSSSFQHRLWLKRFEPSFELCAFLITPRGGVIGRRSPQRAAIRCSGCRVRHGNRHQCVAVERSARKRWLQSPADQAGAIVRRLTFVRSCQLIRLGWPFGACPCDFSGTAAMLRGQ